VAADRWYNGFVGGTVTQSRQAFTLGDAIGVNQPTYFLRQAATGQTLASHAALTQQLIEGVRSYAGQTITILGWARRSSGTGNMAVEGQQTFGTGGSPSANVTAISPTTVSLTTSFAPFAVVLSVPSVTGKTLGSNGNDFFCLNFWTSAGSDFNARTNSLGLQTIGVDLWGIHIRVGTWSATDADLYRPRDPGTELALCQRYYLSGTFIGANLGPLVPGGDTNRNFGSAFPVTMRVAPVISANGSNIGALAYSSTSASFSIGGNPGSNIQCTVNAFTADAEL
jgi:hypothetical protein